MWQLHKSFSATYCSCYTPEIKVELIFLSLIDGISDWTTPLLEQTSCVFTMAFFVAGLTYLCSCISRLRYLPQFYSCRLQRQHNPNSPLISLFSKESADNSLLLLQYAMYEIANLKVLFLVPLGSLVF